MDGKKGKRILLMEILILSILIIDYIETKLLLRKWKKQTSRSIKVINDIKEN
jgi:hypothetical protein